LKLHTQTNACLVANTRFLSKEVQNPITCWKEKRKSFDNDNGNELPTGGVTGWETAMQLPAVSSCCQWKFLGNSPRAKGHQMPTHEDLGQCS